MRLLCSMLVCIHTLQKLVLECTCYAVLLLLAIPLQLSVATSSVGAQRWRCVQYKAENAGFFLPQQSGRRRGVPTYSPRYEEALMRNGVVTGAPRIDISKNFTVLGIETSCDDTAAAVVRSDGEVLGQCVESQSKLLEQFGGVNPFAAHEAHVDAIQRTIQSALSQAGMDSANCVDVIAMAVGPGLEFCLRVGYESAVALCKAYSKPFMAIHHLEAHCLSPRLVTRPSFLKNLSKDEKAEDELNFPYLAVLISGGHSQIILVKGIANYMVLGTTLDDAMGEAFDKAARYMGLPLGMSGGPAIERAARNGDPLKFTLPVPMKHSKTLDFSFAGLKNSFKQLIRNQNLTQLGENKHTNGTIISDLAATFQNHSFQHLFSRVNRALELCETLLGIHCITLVGGVASNISLREQLAALCHYRSLSTTHKTEFNRNRQKLREIFHKLAKLKASELQFSEALNRLYTVKADAHHSGWEDIVIEPFNTSKLEILKKQVETLKFQDFLHGVRRIQKNSCHLRLNNTVANFTHIDALPSLPQGASNVSLESLINSTWPPWTVITPPNWLCKDNGVMVAWAAIEKLIHRNGQTDGYRFNEEKVLPRWPLGSPSAQALVASGEWFLLKLMQLMDGI